MAVEDYFPLPSEEELLIKGLRGQLTPPQAPRRPPIPVPQLVPGASRLNASPSPPTNPAMPDMPDRPDVGSLYNRLETLNQTPVDYSALEGINKARLGQSQTDMGAGLAMQMLGGKTMRPSGAAVFKQALEMAEPLRANMADVGYTHPTTGEFVENPLTKRTREEKVIIGRIDALTKEQDRKAQLALQQGRADEAAAARTNADALRMLALSIAADRNAVAREKQNKGTDGKPLLLGEQRDLTTAAKEFQSLDRLANSFKDEFAGGVAGTLGAEASNYIARNFPKAAEKVVGKDAVDTARKQAEFWSMQKYYDELPTRHEIFGATLTEGESRAWKAAAIQPGMNPKDIRENLNIRRQIIQDNVERLREMHIANGKKPEAVNAATKGVPKSGAVNPNPTGKPLALPSASDIEAELARRQGR